MTMWRDVFWAFVVWGMLSPAAGHGPTTSPQVALPVPSAAALSGFSNDYQIGPGDLLHITVVNEPSLTQTLRISNSGEISFSMLGIIPVADLTTFDLELQIADRLQKKGLVQQAEVVVFVREYQAKPFYVSGAVVNPGEYVMSHELTTLDAIVLAGGLRFSAGQEAFLHRRVSAEGKSWSPETLSASPGQERAGVEIIRLDLRPFKEGRFRESAIPLRRGDVLVVPETLLNPFYVVGEVIAPRNFAFPPDATMSVSKAIAWAGGPTRTAKPSNGLLIRMNEKGERQDIVIDYPAILKGAKPDVQVLAHDIIFVPGSKIRTITQGMLDISGGMAMSAGFRVGRSYQMPDAPARQLPDR